MHILQWFGSQFSGLSAGFVKLLRLWLTKISCTRRQILLAEKDLVAVSVECVNACFEMDGSGF